MANIRVVLDTNVLVSGFAYPASVPGRIVNAWRQGGIDVALSQYILDELMRVLPRLPRVQLSAAEIQDLINSLMFMADIVEPDINLDNELRDPADQPVLGTFYAANAKYLITGDKDLLVLANRLPILTPAQFWAQHGE